MYEKFEIFKFKKIFGVKGIIKMLLIFLLLFGGMLWIFLYIENGPLGFTYFVLGTIGFVFFNKPKFENIGHLIIEDNEVFVMLNRKNNRQYLKRVKCFYFYTENLILGHNHELQKIVDLEIVSLEGEKIDIICKVNNENKNLVSILKENKIEVQFIPRRRR